MDREADRDASNVRFGARIRAIRESRHWSRPDLAKRSGITISTLRRWEEGLNEVGINGAIALAQAFGMDLPTLLGQQDDVPPQNERLRASDVDALVAFAAAVGSAASHLGSVASSSLRSAVDRARDNRPGGGDGQAEGLE